MNLKINGMVAHELELDYGAMKELAEQSGLVTDVSELSARRKGSAIKLTSLLQKAGPAAAANYLTLHADTDNFSASVRLELVRDAVVIFELDGGLLSKKDGGPFRFLVPDAVECRTGELDECTNVKFLSRIVLSDKRGRDSRPQNEEEHAQLHSHD